MIEEKISGVTEIVKLDNKTRYDIIQRVRYLNDKYKAELFGAQ